MNNPYPGYMHNMHWHAAPPPHHGHWHHGYYPGYPPYPYSAPMPAEASSGSRFIKGALVGAVVAYLLTNETVQQSAIKTAVKAWSMVQGGVEEMKERFRDAEAELHANQMEE